MKEKDGALKGLTRRGEAEFEAKAEKMLAGHRQAPRGRNVFAFKMRNLDNATYKDKFDGTFLYAPDGPRWWDSRFCPGCDKRKWNCKCAEGVTPEPVRFMVPRGVIRG